MTIYSFLKQIDWDLILSLIAICISLYALYTSNKLQKQNLSLILDKNYLMLPMKERVPVIEFGVLN